MFYRRSRATTHALQNLTQSGLELRLLLRGGLHRLHHAEARRLDRLKGLLLLRGELLVALLELVDLLLELLLRVLLLLLLRLDALVELIRGQSLELLDLLLLRRRRGRGCSGRTSGRGCPPRTS